MKDNPSFIGLPVKPDQSACKAQSITSWRRLKTLPEKSSSCCWMLQPIVLLRLKFDMHCGTYFENVKSSLIQETV